MKEDVVLSIVIPVYNSGKLLEETLDSIEKVNFTYPYEVILVNDGSKDEITLDVLNKYRDRFLVIDKENGGPSSARNLGISKAKGEYILPFDSDDIMNEDYYNQAIKYLLEHNEIDVLYGDFILFGYENKYNRSGEYNRIRLIQSGNYISIAAIFKKEIWEEVGGYNEKLFYAEDWCFWSAAAIKDYKFHYLEKPLFKYRREENSTSLSHTQGHKYTEALKVIREQIPASIFTQESISEYVLTSLKENKKLKLKLLVLLFFPKLSKYLLKKGYFPNKIIVE